MEKASNIDTLMEKYEVIVDRVGEIRRDIPTLKYEGIPIMNKRLSQLRIEMVSTIEEYSQLSANLQNRETEKAKEDYFTISNKREEIEGDFNQLEQEFYTAALQKYRKQVKTIQQKIKGFLQKYKKECQHTNDLQAWDKKYNELEDQLEETIIPNCLLQCRDAKVKQEALEITNKLKAEIKTLRTNFLMIRESFFDQIEKYQKNIDMKEKIVTTFKAYQRISLEELSEILEVENAERLKKWIIDNSSEMFPLKIDGSFVILKSHVDLQEEESMTEIERTIIKMNELHQSFEESEKKS
ncbi:MAG: hypothetical protein GF308_09490 [Candidatus Heimdallarchaeota archaeon]|nr:hypothetical protein [Candidatus Heimdallarchaeota archaeon]